MNFKKKDTLMVKGIAILFLYCYHCFSDESRLAGVDVIFSPFSKSTAMYIAESMNICVGMFAFLTVYGMTIQLKTKYPLLKLSVSEKMEFCVKRYISLWTSFFIPFLFCEIVTWLVGGYSVYGDGIVEKSCNFILDMFGVSMFFGTPMLVGTWWYMSFTVLLIFVQPFFVDLYRKYKLLIIPVWAFILLLSISEVNNMNRWLFVIPLGICCADGDWFYRLYKWKGESRIAVWLKRFIICGVFLLLVFLRKHEWGLAHLRLIINSVLPVFIIYLSYDLLFKHEGIKKVFEFFGKHSGNMFFTQTSHINFSYAP